MLLAVDAKKDLFILAAAAIVLMAACSLFPLLIYSSTLAIFGLMHVATELRYVDGRFSNRFSPSLRLVITALLLGIVVLRAVGIAGLLNPFTLQNAELSLVLLLASLATYQVQAGDLFGRLILFAFVASLGLGFIFSPILILVILSVLHNLTPIGFLAESFEGKERRQIMLLCAIFFGIIPLLIATGLPVYLFSSFVPYSPHFSFFAMGDLTQHLGVYVPALLGKQPWTYHLFAAVVFMQCMHYVAVIGILPRLVKTQEKPRPVLKWPRASIFWLLVLIPTAFFIVFFTFNFGKARSFYGIAAAVHAWLELPVLLGAFLERRLKTTAHPLQTTPHWPEETLKAPVAS